MKKIQLIVSTLLLSTSFIASTSISKASAEEIPEPECINVFEETACGYNCRMSNNGREAACAEWPGGKCSSSLETVSCGPPAPDNWTRDYEDDDDDFDDYRSRDRDRDRDRDCDCDCD